MKIPLGIEITDQYLKVIVSPKQQVLSDIIAQPILSFSDAQIQEAIAGIIHRLRLKAKSAMLCLPRSLVTVRNLHLPSQDSREIAQMIDLHIGRIVPYKKEEIVFGYESLGVDDMGYSKEVLAITHNDVIRRQAKILEMAGFFIDKIALSSYGAWQWVLNNHRADINQVDLYLLLDVDTTYTDFIIFSYRNLIFTRSIAIGTNDVKANEELGLTKLLGEVKQSLIIFSNEETNKKPVKIFLAGAEIVQRLNKRVENEFDVPLKIVISPHHAASHARGGQMPDDVSLNALAELMMQRGEKGIAFMLPEIQIRKSLREKSRELTILGTLLIYLFTLTFIFFWEKMQNQQTYLKMLNQRNKALEQDVGDLARRYKRVKFIKQFLSLRKTHLLFLAELQKVTPPAIAATLVVMDDAGKVTLRGQSSQLSDVFKFITALEGSKYFKDIATKYTRTRKVKDKEVTDFEISCEFKI